MSTKKNKCRIVKRFSREISNENVVRSMKMNLMKREDWLRNEFQVQMSIDEVVLDEKNFRLKDRNRLLSSIGECEFVN